MLNSPKKNYLNYFPPPPHTHTHKIFLFFLLYNTYCVILFSIPLRSYCNSFCAPPSPSNIFIYHFRSPRSCLMGQPLHVFRFQWILFLPWKSYHQTWIPCHCDSMKHDKLLNEKSHLNHNVGSPSLKKPIYGCLHKNLWLHIGIQGREIWHCFVPYINCLYYNRVTTYRWFLLF